VNNNLKGRALKLPDSRVGRIVNAYEKGHRLALVLDMNHDCAAVWAADRTKGGGMAQFKTELCRHDNPLWWGVTGCGQHTHCMGCGGIVDPENM